MRYESSSPVVGFWPNEVREPEGGTAPALFSNSASAEHRVMHVLVVDDDAAMRTMIADYLSAQNFR